MKKFICILFILNIFILNTSVYAEPAETEISSEEATESGVSETAEPYITAETAVVIDPETGIVLYNKNADQQMYPASITKIMTSLLAIEYAESRENGFEEIVTHSHNAVYNIGPGSSHIGMREGEQITLDQALYGILLASANEVCMAVAEHIDGSVDAFVDRMNERAKELGAVNTHFANPHGFHDDNHYTTAHDISLIMAEAVKHEAFIKYISTYEYQIPFTNIVQEIRYLHNSNKLISPYSNYQWEGCIGGKTGFTDQAGNTLVIYGGNGNKKLIAAVMKETGAGNAYTDTRALIEYAEKLYDDNNIIDVFSADTPIKDINIIQDGEIVGTASVSPDENFQIELPKSMSLDDITIDMSAASCFEAPVGIGKSAGTAYALFNGKVICTANLIITDIKSSSGESSEYIALKEAEKATGKKLGIFNIIIIAVVAAAALLIIFVILYLINCIIENKKREKRIKMRELERREKRKAQLSKLINGEDEDKN